MGTSFNITVCFVLLGSALAYNVHPSIEPSGFFEDKRHEAPGGYIVGGIEAGEAQFPHSVAILMTSENGDVYTCAGSLISQNYVLTAGYCVYGLGTLKLVFGAHNLTDTSEPNQVVRYAESDSSTVIIHPEYRPPHLENNIAVIRLIPPVRFTNTIKSVRLATEEPAEGTVVSIYGWGKIGYYSTYTTTLHYGEVLMASDSICLTYYGTYYLDNLDRYICLDPALSPTTACTGDGGGGMNYMVGGQNTIGGISSFGIGCDETVPFVYISVPFFLEWIREVTGINA